jgi:hypothetical protein
MSSKKHPTKPLLPINQGLRRRAQLPTTNKRKAACPWFWLAAGPTGYFFGYFSGCRVKAAQRLFGALANIK